MNILFDSQAFDMQMHGGVSRCFAELAMHMPIRFESKIAVVETNNAYLCEKGWDEPGAFYERFIKKGEFPCKGRLFDWYQKYVMKMDYWHNLNKDYSINLLKKGCFDVFHPTFFDDYFLSFLNGKPFVLTIHDMIPELYPQYFKADDKQILMKRKLAPLASAIIAVSEKTKQDVVRILNVPEEKVHVVYHGCSFPKIENSKALYEEPYILYVGDRKGYKNFNLFVREVVKNLKKHPELKIVCTGKSFSSSELELFQQMGVANRLIHHWVKTDEEFFSLYHHAVCFVYSSEYEGFGIPILEAYQADCPVMLNNASCFPEIAGDAAIYFSLTRSSSNFASQFESLYEMSMESRENLLNKQRSRFLLYSWEKSAQQLFEVYKTVTCKEL